MTFNDKAKELIIEISEFGEMNELQVDQYLEMFKELIQSVVPKKKEEEYPDDVMWNECREEMLKGII